MGLSTKYHTQIIQFNHNPNPKDAHQVNQADRVGTIILVEDNNAEEEKKSRAAEFESRATNIGITEEKLIAQMVAI